MIEILKLFYSKWALVHCKRIGVVVCFLLLFWLYIDHVFTRQPRRIAPKIDAELYNFQYLIDNDICEEDPYLLILVHTAVHHFEHRNVIRDTWKNEELDLPIIKVVFLLGTTDKFQSKIEKENERFGDIIQGDFVDSYRNLTYKHVMGLSWAAMNCNGTKYVMKMDDDIFIDIYQWMDHIENRMKNLDLKNNIACYFQTGMPVVRDSVSKWFVSKEEFVPETFDNYCSGWAYLTTTLVANRLYEAAKKLPYFWVDDVHITGTAAKLAGVGHIRLNNLFSLESSGLIDWTRRLEKLKWDKVFAPTWSDLVLSKMAIKKAFKCYRMKCKCCYKPATTPKPTTTSTTVKGVAQLIKHPLHKNKFT